MNSVFCNNNFKNSCLPIRCLDRMDTGVHVVDAKGYSIYYNEAAEKVDGLKKDQILGKSMYTMVEEGVFSRSVALEVIRLNSEMRITQRVNQRYVLATGIPVREGQDLTAVIVYVRDIESIIKLQEQVKEIQAANREMAEDLLKYRAEYLEGDLIVAKSPQMTKMVELADQIANVDTTIFLDGETGVGKTKFAKAIHDRSSRQKGPFVKVDCSAIPETLIESELFGYEGGSFTGALKGGKVGLVMEANGGTLFLDEVGDLPLASQVKILTLLQEKTIQPIGSVKRETVNIRVISATNKDLEQMIEDGTFREDLYYRLKVIPLRIPPLRERRLDIVPLIQLFVMRINNYYNRQVEMTPEAISVLLDYSWPGNVRELENVIERLVVTCGEARVCARDVREALSRRGALISHHESFKDKVEAYEMDLIKALYAQSDSIKAMAQLGKINESTLRKKIERFNLDIDFTKKT